MQQNDATWFEFGVPMRPRGKERHRVSVSPRGKAHCYNPTKNEEAERIIRLHFLEMRNELPANWCWPIHGSCAVELVFRTPRPKNPKPPRSFPRSPDVDNAAKLVLDALNGQAFVDDSQVVDLRARKEFGDELILVRIRPLSST